MRVISLQWSETCLNEVRSLQSLYVFAFQLTWTPFSLYHERLIRSDLVCPGVELQYKIETKFHVKPLPHARIPIVKLSLEPSHGLPLGIACDIGFENRLALENTRLLLCDSMVDPTRVRTLVLFRKFTPSFNGTRNPFFISEKAKCAVYQARWMFYIWNHFFFLSLLFNHSKNLEQTKVSVVVLLLFDRSFGEKMCLTIPYPTGKSILPTEGLYHLMDMYFWSFIF